MGVDQLSREGWHAAAVVGGTLLEIERDRADAAEARVAELEAGASPSILSARINELERDLAEVALRLKREAEARAEWQLSSEARGRTIHEREAKIARLEAQVEAHAAKLNAAAQAEVNPEVQRLREAAAFAREEAERRRNAEPWKPKLIAPHLKRVGKLIGRVLADDGAEAGNALHLLKEIATKHGMIEPERLFYLDDKLTDPLLYVVQTRDEEIAELKARLAKAERPEPAKAAASAPAPKPSPKPAPVPPAALSGLFGALTADWQTVAEMLPAARANGFTGSPQTIYNRLRKAASAELIAERGAPGSYQWKLKHEDDGDRYSEANIRRELRDLGLEPHPEDAPAEPSLEARILEQLGKASTVRSHDVLAKLVGNPPKGELTRTLNGLRKRGLIYRRDDGFNRTSWGIERAATAPEPSDDDVLSKLNSHGATLHVIDYRVAGAGFSIANLKAQLDRLAKAGLVEVNPNQGDPAYRRAPKAAAPTVDLSKRKRCPKAKRQDQYLSDFRTASSFIIPSMPTQWRTDGRAGREFKSHPFFDWLYANAQGDWRIIRDAADIHHLRVADQRDVDLIVAAGLTIGEPKVTAWGTTHRLNLKPFEAEHAERTAVRKAGAAKAQRSGKHCPKALRVVWRDTALIERLEGSDWQPVKLPPLKRLPTWGQWTDYNRDDPVEPSIRLITPDYPTILEQCSNLDAAWHTASEDFIITAPPINREAGGSSYGPTTIEDAILWARPTDDVLIRVAVA